VIGYDAVPRYGELINRLTGESEIVPGGLILELDRAEWRALKKEALWHHGNTRAALAANFSSLSIVAKDTTRVSVVQLVMIINAQAAAQTYKLGETNGLIGDTSTKAAARDQRLATISTALALRAQGGDALPSLPAFSIPAGQTLFVPVEWPIVTGTAFSSYAGLTLQGGVVNQEVTAYFWGYERFLRPEERVLD
jgi:hypothetical protein